MCIHIIKVVSDMLIKALEYKNSNRQELLHYICTAHKANHCSSLKSWQEWNGANEKGVERAIGPRLIKSWEI